MVKTFVELPQDPNQLREIIKSEKEQVRKAKRSKKPITNESEKILLDKSRSSEDMSFDNPTD